MNFEPTFFANAIGSAVVSSYFGTIKNALTITIAKENLHYVATFLALHFEHTYVSLMDIVAIDLVENPRFQLFYLYSSLWHANRLIVATTVDINSTLESLCNVFPSANWLEREIWDMFGIFFANHLDLRRILTDYGFSGFPLRKDFPISGYYEVYYDEVTKRVIPEFLNLTQEFRLFNFFLPWKNLFIFKYKWT
jgi:NADH:ubiquinone oxidoreductase subunit C